MRRLEELPVKSRFRPLEGDGARLALPALTRVPDNRNALQFRRGETPTICATITTSADD
jgi:hypothetical protein